MASLRFAGRWHDAVSDEDPQACSGLFRTRLLGGYVAKKLGVPEKTVRKWGYSYQALGRQAFLKGNPKTYSYYNATYNKESGQCTLQLANGETNPKHPITAKMSTSAK